MFYFLHIFSFFVNIYFFNFCFSLHDFSLFLYFVRFLFRLFLKQIKDGNLLTDLSSQATNIAGMVRTDDYLFKNRVFLHTYLVSTAHCS